MRERLIKLLLGRIVVGTSPDEDFFSAGPPAAPRQPLDRSRQEALIADIRRQRRRQRRPAAA